MGLLDILPKTEKLGWPWSNESDIHFFIGEKQWPKISIITPSFNQGQYIEETIRSILLQNYPNLEYFVIDGGSSDETVNILEKYSNWVSWVSEKDSGQANALNKGISMATGQIFNWINSDDVLMPNALYEVAKGIMETDVFAGNILNFSKDRTISIGKSNKINEENLILWNTEKKFGYQQPACWLRLDIVKEIGGINETYHYCFDYELMIRYFQKPRRVSYTNLVIAKFRWHEESKSVAQVEKFSHEMNQIHQSILQAPQYAFIHEKLEKRLRYFEKGKTWNNYIQTVIDSRPRIIAILILAFSTLNDPVNRINRAFLGRIKAILLHKK